MVVKKILLSSLLALILLPIGANAGSSAVEVEWKLKEVMGYPYLMGSSFTPEGQGGKLLFVCLPKKRMAIMALLNVGTKERALYMAETVKSLWLQIDGVRFKARSKELLYRWQRSAFQNVFLRVQYKLRRTQQQPLEKASFVGFLMTPDLEGLFAGVGIPINKRDSRTVADFFEECKP